jgi:hypothetical protein
LKDCWSMNSKVHSFVHGYFPDLVALVPENGRQYKLTRRGPYNVHPSFVSGGRYVFFESIRQRDHGGISQIYVLDSRAARFRAFHKGMDLRRVHGYWDQHSIPAVNNAENRVYFYSYSCKCIVSEKITGGDRVETPIKFQYALFKMIWSDDYQYLLVQKSVLKKGGRPIDSYWQIHVYNANTWEVANVLARDGWDITIGDMYEGEIFHTIREVKAGATTEIVSYNTYTGKQKILMTTDELTELDGLKSPVFRDSSIFFIGSSGQKDDIYRFNLQNRELERLTNNNRI